MPIDTRRNQGPENTVQYHLFLKKNEKTYGEFLKDLIDSRNVRKDSRQLAENRKVFIKTSVLSQAKGSAYIEVGKTKVICSAYDPREIPNHSEFILNGELYCEFKYATFAQKKHRGFIRDSEEKELSVCLKRALEPAVCRHEFPNFQVDVYALVLEDDGSVLAAAITCASLALADASIPMYDLVTAQSLGIHGNYLFMDPTNEEESLCTLTPEGDCKNHGAVVVSYATQLQQVTQFKQVGVMDPECIIEATSQLTENCSELYQLAQHCLAQAVIKMTKKKHQISDLGKSFENVKIQNG
ncbi:exosome complex component MTR3-like [Lycorma delicatula]|uniref:exosome complex component MTR3-like n=1 Tax=Lycorma delicatula TaxID=130591 RepID=UPI003F5185EC